MQEKQIVENFILVIQRYFQYWFFRKESGKFLHHILCIISQQKCSSYILLIDQISLTDCLLETLGNVCVLQMSLSQVLTS